MAGRGKITYLRNQNYLGEWVSLFPDYIMHSTKSQMQNSFQLYIPIYYVSVSQALGTTEFTDLIVETNI